MKAELVHRDQMGTSELLRWQQIREQSSSLSSPFFSDQFVHNLSHLRPATRVAVIESDGVIQGFWPLEIQGKKSLPIAYPINEICGLIQSGEDSINPMAVIKQLKLTSWKFDCVPMEQSTLQPYCVHTHRYHWVCLAKGFDQYSAELKNQGSRQIENCRRKWRKFEREQGELRFEWQHLDLQNLDQLIDWKRDQYLRTGTRDVLGIPWVQEFLLQLLLVEPSMTCKGILSGIFLGDRPIALNYGLLENQTLAVWFPVYDQQLAHYSPGSLLFFSLLQKAAELGVNRIELGQGEERYKLSFGNRVLPTIEGIVCRSSILAKSHAAKIRLRMWAENSTWGQVPLRIVRQLKKSLRRQLA